MAHFFRCTHCGRALGAEGDSCSCSYADPTWAINNRVWCDAIHRGKWRDEEYMPDRTALDLVEAAA